MVLCCACTVMVCFSVHSSMSCAEVSTRVRVWLRLWCGHSNTHHHPEEEEKEEDPANARPPSSSPNSATRLQFTKGVASFYGFRRVWKIAGWPVLPPLTAKRLHRAFVGFPPRPWACAGCAPSGTTMDYHPRLICGG